MPVRPAFAQETFHDAIELGYGAVLMINLLAELHSASKRDRYCKGARYPPQSMSQALAL
jgi:hypothetical protein